MSKIDVSVETNLVKRLICRGMCRARFGLFRQEHFSGEKRRPSQPSTSKSAERNTA